MDSFAINTTGNSLGAIVERAAKHTFSNAWLNGITGNDMEHGFITGALTGGVSSLGNSAIDAGGNNLGYKVICSAILGGTVEEIGGGKFANGAVTGAYGMLFNEAMHKGKEVSAKSFGLGEEASTEEVIEALNKNMKEGDYITGEEIGKFNSHFKMATTLLDKVTKSGNGLRISLSKVGKSALLIPSTPNLIDGSRFFVFQVQASNGLNMLHIIGPGSIYFFKEKVVIDIYLHNNAWFPTFKDGMKKEPTYKGGQW